MKYSLNIIFHVFKLYATISVFPLSKLILCNNLTYFFFRCIIQLKRGVIPINYSKFLDFLFKMSAFTRFLESGVIFEEGITLRQFYILDIINRKNKIELSDIHSILKVDKSTTTRLLSPLLKNGFISKVKSTENHRTFSLSLTEKGNIIHNSTSDCISEFLSEVSSEFSIDGDDFFRLTEMVSEVVEKKYCCKK